MRWGSIDWDLQAFYKNLTRLKNSHEALKKGNFAFVKTSGKTIAFLRKSEKETILVAINPSAEKETVSIAEADDPLLEKADPLSLEVAPFGYRMEILSNIG